MHDLDRVQLEMDDDDDEFEVDDFDEFETDFDEDELGWDEEGPFDEDEETELAMELLSVTNDEELEQFLGKVFKKIARTVRKAVRSPLFKKIIRAVKPIAKKLLPIAGRAIGTYFGGAPGGMAGSTIGSTASGLFEIDVTGLSGDELELEVAKRIVRLTGTAARKALTAPTGTPPARAAAAALKAAAKKHAPGLLKKGLAKVTSGSAIKIGPARSGRWVRRGRKIIVLGA